MSDRPDPSVCSVPLETDDGEEVVICQQNVVPDNMVGGGEFKEAELAKPVDEAAAEQEDLERRAPTQR